MGHEDAFDPAGRSSIPLSPKMIEDTLQVDSINTCANYETVKEA
jgi:hypothetical protein